MKIAVIGWGVFGRAIGSLLEYNQMEFTPVDVDLPLDHAVDVVFQMVPTQFIRQAYKTNARFLTPKTIIINGAKGIEEGTHQLPHQILADYPRYHSLIGPSFASGIVNRDPTLVSLGYKTDEHVQLIKKLLQTPYFRIQATPGYESLELASALKNVYAILCGYAEGLGLGANTRAQLITLALQEGAELRQVMKLSGGDVMAPAIVGDLMLTCSSTESRNFQFGKRLASMNQAAALELSAGTVEGLHTSHSIQALAREYKVELPLALLTHRVIEGGAKSAQLFHDFVATL